MTKKRHRIARTTAAFLCIFLLIPGIAGSTLTVEPAARIRIDGEFIQIRYGQYPVSVNDRTLVPLRDVMTSLGFTVEWYQPTDTAYLTKPGFDIVVPIGGDTMTANGHTIYLDVPSIVINDRTLVPLRAIAEATGMLVHWIGEAQIVDIRTDGYSGPSIAERYIDWKFSVYLAPDFHAQRVASFYPQLVHVLYEAPDGWTLIHTYRGPLWAFPHTNFRFIDRTTGLFENKDDTHFIPMRPQLVHILDQDGDWLQITTCFGPKWLNLNFTPPIFTSEPLPEHIIEQITGVTFHPNTPFPHSFLTYLTITHVGFDGKDHIGHMIVAAEIGDEVLDIFREIYESGFPIYSMRLIDYFDANDYLSMAANNSSAFNFRYIANTTTISRHGFGMAIDINPIQNPYVRGNTVLPAAGREYLDRSNVRPGMIVRGDAVYRAFTSRGWTWGGNWNSLQDYHHFERR